MDELNQHMDFLFAEAKLGVEVDKFLSTDVGRYLTGRARQELQEIQEEMLSLPNWRDHRLQELQLKAQGLQKLMSWLTEAINNGNLSEQQLIEAEDLERRTA